jgi:hypothetical protein
MTPKRTFPDNYSSSTPQDRIAARYTCTRPDHDASWDGLCRGTHRNHGLTDEQITEWQDEKNNDSDAPSIGDLITEWQDSELHLINIRPEDCRDALCPHQRLLGY